MATNTTLAQVRKTLTETTPLMAYVGTVDLAVEKARAARTASVARREQLAAEYAPARLQERAAAFAGQAKETPALVLNRGLEIAAKAQTTVEGAQAKAEANYKELATRGRKLVRRVLDQKATKDLVAQAEATVASAKGAVTTAVKGAEDVQTSAKALFTTGRKEATTSVEAITGSLLDEVEVATTEVKAAAKRTRTAAKRTTTTAKKAAESTRTATKRTATTAKKAAADAVKAADKAAEKVGD